MLEASSLLVFTHVASAMAPASFVFMGDPCAMGFEVNGNELATFAMGSCVEANTLNP